MNRQMSRAEILAALSPAERAEVLGDDAAAFEFDWSSWARPSQLPPPGDWSNWLILAGRGFGKTRTGAEWVRANMCGSTPLTGGRWRHIALIAETAADARDVMVGDGKQPSDPSAGSGILQVHPKDFLPLYEPSKRRLTWPNGAAATLYNATEPEALRGPEHAAAWCDELCKWQYQQETWDMLQFGLRAGTDPRICITTTPKPTMLLKQILMDPYTVTTRGSTLDNRANLPPSYIRKLMDKYEGTRLGRQEIDAEILEDIEGALWSRAMIEDKRIREIELPPLMRVVISIDPAASSNENSDEMGIICAGIDDHDPPHFYVLDDVSGIMSPLEWGKQAIALYRARRADRIVAEVNNGGEMVERTLRSIGDTSDVAYSPVWASKGKFVRAEPISALYEQGRVHHVGRFDKLEDQQCAFTCDFNRREMGYSPDRLDALVWGLTELSENSAPATHSFISLDLNPVPRQSWPSQNYSGAYQ
jgi:phage terminase large subunit-like protein